MFPQEPQTLCTLINLRQQNTDCCLCKCDVSSRTTNSVHSYQPQTTKHRFNKMSFKVKCQGHIHC